MHVKTFVGTSTQEVLTQIKAELGADAVILSNRTFRKNGIRCHEMTAGLERPATHTPSLKKGSELSTSWATSRAASRTEPGGWGEWHKEWMQIKDHLFALMKPSIQLERLTPRQRVALEYLQREGVSDVVTLELYRQLLAAPGASILESLSDLVPVRSWGAAAWEQNIHYITGPFGVGKTTAAVRMALQLRKEQPDIRIAFINADSQRGNGRLVLRHWAELSNFHYLEAQDADAMAKAFAHCANAQKIFVDMPGLGRDDTLAACKQSLGLHTIPAATHVVLSPCYDNAQMAALLTRYTVEGEGSLLWTKLDEAISYGSIVNVAAACHLPVSAFSYGAGLRDTLAPATESLLWRLIFKRHLPNESKGTA